MHIRTRICKDHSQVRPKLYTCIHSHKKTYTHTHTHGRSKSHCNNNTATSHDTQHTHESPGPGKNRPATNGPGKSHSNDVEWNKGALLYNEAEKRGYYADFPVCRASDKKCLKRTGTGGAVHTLLFFDGAYFSRIPIYDGHIHVYDGRISVYDVFVLFVFRWCVFCVVMVVCLFMVVPYSFFRRCVLCVMMVIFLVMMAVLYV